MVGAPFKPRLRARGTRRLRPKLLSQDGGFTRGPRGVRDNLYVLNQSSCLRGRRDVERLSGEHMGRVSSIRQVAIASLVGTALEWYDYFLYGTAAALIFGELFFPSVDPLIGTLAAFATF